MKTLSAFCGPHSSLFSSLIVLMSLPSLQLLRAETAHCEKWQARDWTTGFGFLQGKTLFFLPALGTSPSSSNPIALEQFFRGQTSWKVNLICLLQV
jgi:hypothetical protein